MPHCKLGWIFTTCIEDKILLQVFFELIFVSHEAVTCGPCVPTETLYTQISVCIFSIQFSINFTRCWWGDFVSQIRASLIGDHFFYSYDPNFWFKGDISRRNEKPVTLAGQRVRRPLRVLFINLNRKPIIWLHLFAAWPLFLTQFWWLHRH